MSDVDVVSSSSLAADRSVQEESHKAFGTHESLASPPSLPPPEEVPRGKTDGVADGDEVLSAKADSEAETIIQSSRESVSPEKKRKHIQHERRHSHDKIGEDASAGRAGSPNSRKRKRMEDDPRDESERDPHKASPQPRASSVSRAVKIEDTDGLQSIARRRDSAQSGPAVRQTESGDPNARKRSSSESAIEGDATDTTHRIRVNNQEDSARERERREKTHPTPGARQSKDRSLSPAFRTHKRAVSGPQHGTGENLPKKKKTPAPLLTGRHRHSSEDRQSVSSSASGSPMPSGHIRRLTSSDGAATSPAKPMTHKKQRDQNGRTRLARACAAQEVEGVVARHAERPEDLNVADNAGNTPLQIAALEGCAPIVKFLLEAGCEIDTKNIDRDTPLIDAVENGHLEVVRLLLDAGANPRMVNAEGDEPYDLVPSDSEDYEEIRRIIAEAKANPRKRRSEDHGVRANSSKDSVPRAVSASSPRESPPVHATRSPPPAGIPGRRRTVRSEATRNDLLWTKATPENLREFAAKGDMAGVANILNVGQKADTESLIAAAKGGHDDVMQLLLGIGYAEPDPEPLQTGNLRPGYNTPMLAAIGRGNLDVIKLLLGQPGFNPTRRPFRDRTYFELSRERKGENWEEESELLKAAYDAHIRNRKMRRPETKSPRRSRDKEKEVKRSVRRDSSSPVALHNRKAMRSPTSSRHADAAKEPNARDKVREDRLKEKSAIPELDHTRSDHSKSKAPGTERRQSDSAGNRGDEVVVKRRRLIAGRPPQSGERRPSQLSSDSLSGREESKARAERVEAVKRNSPSLKRSRSSLSPERSRSRGSEQRREEDIQKKKRRVLSEDNAQKLTNGTKRSQDSSAEQLKNPSSQESQNMPDSERSKSSKLDTACKSSDEPVPVKEEQKKVDSQELDDIPMDEAAAVEKAVAEAQKREEARRREEEARKAEEERILEEKRAAEAERARIAKEEEEAREAAERAARLAREKAEEEERKRKEAEQRRIKQAEEDRQRRLEQERLRIAKLRREQEEQERRRRDALPNRLRVAANLVGSNDPRARSHTWLKQFMPVVTVTTEQIDSSCEPEIANERWVPNFLVAPLLATNDLQLSQYASWEKRKATPTQRANLWRVTRRILVQADDSEFEGCSFGQVIQKDGETRPKYFEMEHVFWVRLSDFMDLVPHIPHLHGLEIQLLKMHIDREPAPFDGPQVNGNAFYPAENHDNFPVNGLTNGFGHARPSTYV